MISLIRAIILGLVAPKHVLRCSRKIWKDGLIELRRRGGGRRESGAFLLGRTLKGKRQVLRFVYYDDLDPHCLESGVVVFKSPGYGTLWQLCRETGLSVVADVHTHPTIAIQSDADRRHPMIAVPGHIALIVPYFANRISHPCEMGIYKYLGAHMWENCSGKKADRMFYIGRWG